MALFNFKKKLEDDMYCSCCGCATNASVDEDIEQDYSGGEKLSIKVLGSGCKNCRTLLENTKNAVKSLEIDANVEYVTDMEKIAGYGVMSMPALVVNEKVVSAGKVLKAQDIAPLIKNK